MTQEAFGFNDEAREAAAKAVEEVRNPSRITLSTGVVLNIKQVAPLLIRRATANITRPEVPVVWLEDKGRSEPNPDNPDYKAAMVAYEEAIAEAALNAMILTGTTVASKPDDVPGPEDPDFAELLDVLSIPLPVTKPGRYLAWLQFVAFKSMTDFYQVGNAVGRASGLAEEDVQQAVQSFRGDEGRGVSSPVSVPDGPVNGNHVQAVPVGTGF